MFYFLNKHKTLQLVFILPLLIWSIYTIFGQTTMLPNDSLQLYPKLYQYWTSHLGKMKVCNTVLLIINALLLNRFYKSNRFSEYETYMPIIFFLLIMNIGGFLRFITPIHFTMLVLTIIVSFMKDDNDKPIKNSIFAFGLLIALTSLLDPNAIWIALFLVIALLINRFSKFKEILILILSMAIVYLYVIVSLLLAKNFPIKTNLAEYCFSFAIIKSIPQMTITQLVLLVMLVFSTFYFITRSKLYFDNKLIVVRKRFITISVLMFVMMFVLFFSHYKLQFGLIYITVPLTLLFSMSALQKRMKFLNDFLIIAFFVLLCL